MTAFFKSRGFDVEELPYKINIGDGPLAGEWKIYENKAGGVLDGYIIHSPSLKFHVRTPQDFAAAIAKYQDE